MASTKNLKGLPHNFTKSFFSTLRYYHRGYMADWLFNAAEQLNIKHAEIDVLNAKIEPEELNLHPLLINIKDLERIIQSELAGNGFPQDFITVAKIRITFFSDKTYHRGISCFPYMIDKEGNRYEPGEIIEEASEAGFDALDNRNIFPVAKRLYIFKLLQTDSRQVWKKLAAWCLGKWWPPVAFLVCTIGITALALHVKNQVFNYVSILLLLAGIAGLIGLCIYHFIKKPLLLMIQIGLILFLSYYFLCIYVPS